MLKTLVSNDLRDHNMGFFNNNSINNLGRKLSWVLWFVSFCPFRYDNHLAAWGGGGAGFSARCVIVCAHVTLYVFFRGFHGMVSDLWLWHSLFILTCFYM